MTADAYLIILCDRSGCERPEGHWPVRFEPHTHRELRRLLKQHRGWRRTRDGRDLCPNHANQPNQKPMPEPVRAHTPGDQTEISTRGWTA